MKFRRNGQTWQWIGGILQSNGVPAEGYIGEVYYIEGRPAYDPNAEEEQIEPSPEDILRVSLYASAIEELATEDSRYNSNYNMFERWDFAMRLWWINQVEGQAKAGKQTIGVDVVTRAAVIRLTRS